jgi:hypothetical protein
MTWFRRWQQQDQPPPQLGPDAEDRPDELLRKLHELIGFINSNAGRLPVEAVVAARRVTDTVREIIDTADGDQLDIYAVISVKGIMNDYLPTTLRTYLALDPEIVHVKRPSGRTPAESLLEQVNALWLGAADVLAAAHAKDADELVSQGNFLRTKFTGSDLDL